MKEVEQKSYIVGMKSSGILQLLMEGKNKSGQHTVERILKTYANVCS